MSTKSPTIKRILKEAQELASQPSPDYHAAPLESDLFEWHFTLRGPPSPSPFEGGLYHGRIVLPPAYPLKPPSFRFLTPSGRFEVNREICLSISGHHEETWQPAWGIRTALVAIRSFMDTEARGQLGGLEAAESVRRRLAGESRRWGCGSCGRRNEEIMREQEELVKEAGVEGGVGREEVPEELRLGYRDEMGKGKGGTGEEAAKGAEAAAAAPPTAPVAQPAGVAAQSQAATASPASAPGPAPRPPQAPALQAQQPRRPPPVEEIPAWIDKAIYGVAAAIAVLIWIKFLG